MNAVKAVNLSASASELSFGSDWILDVEETRILEGTEYSIHTSKTFNPFRPFTLIHVLWKSRTARQLNSSQQNES